MADAVRVVWVVDDDEGVRRSMQFMLSNQRWRVRAYARPRAFLEEFARSEADCLLIDLQMPEMTGLEVVRCLRGRGERLPVVVLTAHGTVPAAVEAMRLGAVDFLEKPVSREPLLRLVGEALERDARMQESRREVAQTQRRLDSLSPRERELLDLIVAGLANKQIAAKLHLAEKTVANHRARLMHKMGAVNAADLTRSVALAWQARREEPAPPEAG